MINEVNINGLEDVYNLFVKLLSLMFRAVICL